jgi:hypothetical protein
MKAVLTLFIFILIISLFAKDVFAQVVINEFVPNADEEWVEFHNASESADFIKEYWIDDDPNGGKAKKQLTALNIDNPKYPYFSLGSGYLNNSGDKIILYDNNNNIIDQYEFSSVPGPGLPIGRYPDAIGSFAFLTTATLGASNASPVAQPTPTLSPTSSPTPSPSPRPTPTSTSKSTATPQAKEVVAMSIEEFANMPTPVSLPSSAEPSTSPIPSASENAVPVLAAGLTLGGGGFLVAGMWPIFRKLKKSWV